MITAWHKHHLIMHGCRVVKGKGKGNISNARPARPYKRPRALRSLQQRFFVETAGKKKPSAEAEGAGLG
jgi:hypothetical protein